MTTIAVVGGRGYLGRRVSGAIAQLRNARGLTVGRHPSNDLIIDLSRPETLRRLQVADLVVNCSDSIAAPPDLLVEHCARAGLPLIETTAHAPTIERLLAAETGGPLLLGAGLFPGLSNLAAKSAYVGTAGDPVTICVRSSPASGAGAGTVAMMVDLMSLPALSYAEHTPIQRRPFGAPCTVLVGSKRRRAVAVRLPEATMFHRATGADVRTLFSPMPGFITPLLRVLSLIGRARIARAVLRAQLRVLRGVLLRWRKTPVEIAAECGDRRPAVFARDGMRAAAAAVAAMTDAVRSGHARLSGTMVPEQLFGIRDIAERMDRLGEAVEMIG